MRRKKELDADSKAIQQIKFVGELKNVNDINNDGAESMFALTILEKNRESKSKFYQGSVTVS